MVPSVLVIVSPVWLESSPNITSRFRRCNWELAWSASGVCQGYRELARTAQGSLPEDYRGSRKACWEYRAKVWTMQWELAGSSLGLRRRYQEDCWEHAGRSPEEDRETHRRKCRRLPDYGE
ncbi:hypothetical protein BHE74_00048178 [Ensete ventricosum]|uniref:Uncharacterized protein n=1 Tax=Ensete ventricosum TaxID=4639 RepID=A0A445MC90_ENSVE|nr:hypothetical protein BHE74_00048178 [Ensete ventricosum]RZR71819.1 hypothetical protein BHM03_00007706 [Ensete ventricosum]